VPEAPAAAPEAEEAVQDEWEVARETPSEAEGSDSSEEPACSGEPAQVRQAQAEEGLAARFQGIQEQGPEEPEGEEGELDRT